jgi:N-acetylglucosaminyldiphosphoundecaprenol N-acetyl-beta-D-mannosaminyltransferase
MNGDVRVLEYKISSRGLYGDVVNTVNQLHTCTKAYFMACINPHSLITAENDDTFREALNSADVLLPDGAGIVLAAKVLRKPIRERVAGYEYFTELSKALQKTQYKRVFFLGSTDQVLDLIKQRFENDFPELTVCGTYSPPFKDEFTKEDNAHMVKLINSSHADIVWVGLTAPKQEKWINNNNHEIKASFVGAVGAVFDFYAGTRGRAPKWVCDLGLEWFPRLIEDPKRLWRRNFISTPKFLLKLAWVYVTDKENKEAYKK